MSTNTKQSNGVNNSAPVAAPVSSDKAGKPTIKMAPHGPLTALHALAASYRGLIDLLKDMRQEQIEVLNNFIEDGWKKAYDAAADSKHALFMQAGASLLGGALSLGGAAANGLTSGAAKQQQQQAAANSDYLKGLKTKLSDGEPLTLSGEYGQQAQAAQNTQPNPGTARAMTMLREGRFADLRTANNLPAGTANHISDANISDASKLIRVGAQGTNRAEILERIDNHIGRWTNEGLIASNKIAQQEGLNKNLVDLAQGVQQGGFSIQQALDTEKSRQEEADVARIAQAQRMADQSQSDFGGSTQETARDLRSVSEQIGRLVPQRG